MVYQCHEIEAAEATSIQTNLKMKHSRNLISYVEQKNVSPPKMLLPLPSPPISAIPSIINFYLFFYTKSRPLSPQLQEPLLFPT